MVRAHAARSRRDARRLYGDLAWIWPHFSPPSDYVAETRQYVRLLRRHARGPVRTVLDLGCGGGHNDAALKRSFDITGVDLSEPMLALARRLNPEVRYVVGDMRTVRLKRRFDAVTIFDSVSYMLSEDDLRGAFATAFAHLRPGGVLLTFVERTAEGFHQNKAHLGTVASGGVEITHLDREVDPDPTDTTYETTMVFLLRRGGQTTVETDHHVCGLFPRKTWDRLLRKTGFVVREARPESTEPGDDPAPILLGLKPVGSRTR